MPRRYTLDQLAQRINERETHRATGTQDLTLEGIGAAGHWNEISHEQRKNWNLTDDDMVDIENALEDNSIFETEIVKTKETSVAQCNDAVRKMKQGDYSRFNHLPPFLREYYGKKKLEAFFGEEDAIPPLDQNMKRRLNGNLKNPAFRYMITTLITRNAVDFHGNPIAEQLREYDRYMNQKTLALTMDPISEVEKGHLRKKFGEEKANAIMADNLEKQRFMAKTLFMTQLGRVDIHPEEGEYEPLKDTVTGLFAHGTRVMFTLPSGNSTDQSMLFREWKQRVQDTSVLKEYRFASHDIKRRHVNDNEEKTRDIREIKLKWMDQLTNRDFKNKYFTYLGNYGMNVPLGGLGRSFNGTDCVDDQGSFGHMYIRAKTGEENRCGALLIGIENAAPHSTSCIGQHHGGKAIGHDMSCFFSNRTNVGKIYGGREVDLSHFKPNELSRALRLFDMGYSELQREAATDPAAAKKLRAVNSKLTGKYMSALELAGLAYHDAKLERKQGGF